jgi:hypothetical protein
MNQSNFHAFFQQRGYQREKWLVIDVQILDVCRPNPHRPFGFFYQ